MVQPSLPLCRPLLPVFVMFLRVSVLGSRIAPGPGDILLARDGVLKCPAAAAAVTMTTWGKKKPNLVQNVSLVFFMFYLLSEPHHKSMRAAPATSQCC